MAAVLITSRPLRLTRLPHTSALMLSLALIGCGDEGASGPGSAGTGGGPSSGGTGPGGGATGNGGGASGTGAAPGAAGTAVCAPADTACVAARCGDGVEAPNEFCDDANDEAGDGCSDKCAVESGFKCDGSPSVCKKEPTGTETEDIDYPAGIALVHDVKKEFGAVGDGATDDTEALRDAFSKFRDGDQLIYLPPGTYLVSDHLNFGNWTYVQGAGMSRTKIQLKDAVPAYGDPGAPRWVIGSLPQTPPDISGACNMCFSNYLSDLTIDTGRGNPGAIGFELLTNNGGGAENVVIRSGDGAGFIGLDLRHQFNGPGYSRNVTIEGFDRGIVTAESTYSSVFEHIFLKKQNVAGFENRGHPVSVRHLESENSVPAYVTEDGDSAVNVLIDFSLKGGGAANPGIRVTGSGGVIYARNVTTVGYGHAIDNRGAKVAGPVAEWFSGKGKDAWQSLFGDAAKASLKLPVRDRPFVPRAPSGEWVNMESYRSAAVDDDAAPAIQAAIDAGARVITFPGNFPPIRTTVRLRNKLEWVVAYYGRVDMKDKAAPAWRLEDGTSPVVGFQYVAFGGALVEHASTRTLIVHHSRHMGYRTAPHPTGLPLGDLFVDDMSGAPFTFSHPQNAWLRMLNTEGTGVRMTNDLATLWVLGYKTEAVGSDLVNGAGAKTEILGGLTYPTNRDAPFADTPLYRNNGGALSVIARMADANPIRVREVLGGQTRSVTVANPDIGNAKVLAYTSGM